MVSKKRQKQILDEWYTRKKEEVYYKNMDVVEIEKARNREEELFSLGEYLPNLLRGFLSLDYYTNMRERSVIDKVLSEMAKTRKQGIEEDVIEFINWIDSHKDFKDLLNEEKVKDLGGELEVLEKEYNKFKKIIDNSELNNSM